MEELVNISGVIILGLSVILELVLGTDKIENLFTKRMYRSLVKTGKGNLPRFWREAEALMEGKKRNWTPVVKLIPLALVIPTALAVQSLTPVAVVGIGFLILTFLGRFLRRPKTPKTFSAKERWAWKLQATVVRALTDLEGSEARDKLAEWILEDQAFISGIVLEELSKRGERWMLPLLQAGANHPQERVRTHVLESFIRSPLPEFQQEIPSFTDDFSPEIKQIALEALKKLSYETAAPAYRKALMDNHPEVRNSAKETAREFEQRRLNALCNRLFTFSGDPADQQIQVKLLPEIRLLASNPFSAVSLALDRADPSTRPESAQHLLDTLRAVKPQERVICLISSLGRYSDAEAARALLRTLSTQKNAYRKAALEALKAMEHLDGNVVLEGLKHGNNAYKRSIFALASRFKGDVLFNIFSQLIWDKDLNIRLHAVKTISRMEAFPRKIALLKNQLTDSSREIRMEVYTALQANQGLQIAPVLLEKRARLLTEQRVSNMGKGPKSEVVLTEKLVRDALAKQGGISPVLEHFFCTNCLTRPFIKDWQGVRVPQCRRCGKIETQQAKIATVEGRLGAHWREPRQQGDTYIVNVWNPKTRTAIYADLDRLTIEPDLPDLDWAINAVVDALENGAPPQRTPLTITAPASLNLSPNARRLLAQIGRLEIIS